MRELERLLTRDIFSLGPFSQALVSSIIQSECFFHGGDLNVWPVFIQVLILNDIRLDPECFTGYIRKVEKIHAERGGSM